VTYRYSLLNQNDGVSYDDELENALTKAGLYHDSSDDDVPLRTLIRSKPSLAGSMVSAVTSET